MLFKDDHHCLIIRGKTKEGVKRETRFWAERGLVHCEDSIDNSYRSMSVRTFLRRVKAILDMLGKKGARYDTGADAHLREYMLRISEKAQEVAVQAQEQGMPSDQSARNALMAARAKSVYMGGTSGKANL